MMGEQWRHDESIGECVVRALANQRKQIADKVRALGCTGLPKHGGPLCGDDYIDEHCCEHAIADMIEAG